MDGLRMFTTDALRCMSYFVEPCDLRAMSLVCQQWFFVMERVPCVTSNGVYLLPEECLPRIRFPFSIAKLQLAASTHISDIAGIMIHLPKLVSYANGLTNHAGVQDVIQRALTMHSAKLTCLSLGCSASYADSEVPLTMPSAFMSRTLLRSLCLSGRDWLGGDVPIVALVSICTNLQHFDVSDTGGRVTDASIRAVAEHCPLLEHLNVSNTGKKITDASICAVATKCRGLRHLDVSWTEGGVTDVSVLAIAEKCDQLRYLNVRNTGTCVTDVSVIAIAGRCAHLTDINVRNSCRVVTEASVLALAASCPRLRQVNVSNTGRKMTSVGIKALVASCPRLMHLWVSNAEGRAVDIPVVAMRARLNAPPARRGWGSRPSLLPDM